MHRKEVIYMLCIVLALDEELQVRKASPTDCGLVNLPPGKYTLTEIPNPVCKGEAWWVVKRDGDVPVGAIPKWWLSKGHIISPSLQHVGGHG